MLKAEQSGKHTFFPMAIKIGSILVMLVTLYNKLGPLQRYRQQTALLAISTWSKNSPLVAKHFSSEQHKEPTKPVTKTPTASITHRDAASADMCSYTGMPVCVSNSFKFVPVS